MWLTMAFLCFLFNGISAFFFKVNAMKKGSTDGLLWGFYVAGTIGACVFTWYTSNWEWSWSIVIAGCVIGLGAAMGNLLYSKAVHIGPAGLTAMISHSHVVLIVLMSILLYQEKLTLYEGIAICLLIAGILLLPLDPDQQLRIQNRLWYLFVGCVFVFFFIRNGGLKITEEMNLNNTPIILITYIFGLLCFTGTISLKKQIRTPAMKIGVLQGLVSGIFSFGMMQSLAYALSIGPAGIISPIASANGIIVALLSYLIYQERLSILQLTSFCLLLVGVILLRI